MKTYIYTDLYANDLFNTPRPGSITHEVQFGEGLRMQWVEGKREPVFHVDDWQALPELFAYQNMLARLKAFDTEQYNLTPERFCQILDECGFENKTPRPKPTKSQMSAEQIIEVIERRIFACQDVAQKFDKMAKIAGETPGKDKNIAHYIRQNLQHTKNSQNYSKKSKGRLKAWTKKQNIASSWSLLMACVATSSMSRTGSSRASILLRIGGS